MLLTLIPTGDFCVIQNLDNAENEFKTTIFKYIVNKMENFNWDDIPELITLVENLPYENGKQYSIEFGGEQFSIKAIVVEIKEV